MREIRLSIRPADTRRPTGRLIARAETVIPRAGFVLINAALEHADRACPDAGAEPTAGFPMLDSDSRYRVVEYAFRCYPKRALPNDILVSADDILNNRWSPSPAHAKSLTSWMVYDYPRMRAQVAFDILLGAQVARAASDCGRASVVVDRIESHTEAPRPEPGDGRSQRHHAVRLLYRCLTDSPAP